MDWRKLPPCYHQLPDPVFLVTINGCEIPVVLLPEELLSKRLRNIGIRVYVFLGFMTPTGNIKWIPAHYMVRKALATGRIARKKSKLVEPTSGNFGLSLAYCAAEEDIPVYAIVSDSLPSGKLQALLRFGAQVVTESEAVRCLGLSKSPGSIELARLFAKKIGGEFLNQYNNFWNAESYATQVVPQVLEQVGVTIKKIKMFVASVGSGGTFEGMGKRLLAHNPDLELVATMPYLGQEIDGTRDEERLLQVGNPWNTFAESIVIEPIDQRTARAVSHELNQGGIPGGPSSGAVLGTTDHMLVLKVSRGQLGAMRGVDDTIDVFIPFADTSYPYA